jgi:hypothetical protein
MLQNRVCSTRLEKERPGQTETTEALHPLEQDKESSADTEPPSVSSEGYGEIKCKERPKSIAIVIVKADGAGRQRF